MTELICSEDFCSHAIDNECAYDEEVRPTDYGSICPYGGEPTRLPWILIKDVKQTTLGSD